MDIWKVWTALIVVALVMRHWCLVRAASILLGNWAILHWFYAATGDQFNWLVNFGVDYAAASLMLVNCDGRAQLPSIAMFLPMLIAHVAYAWSAQGVVAQWNYYWTYLYLALIQAALLGLAVGHGGMEALRHRRRSDRGSPAGASNAARMVGSEADR